MQKLTLSSHYTVKNILRQCLSPILMMLFTSIYVVVDGLFISNIVGSDAFGGVNLIYPIIMIVGGFGFMFGSGGSALVSKLLGQGNKKKANEVFGMMVYSSFILVLILSIVMFFFIKDIAEGLAKLDPNSTKEMVDNAIRYGRILILSQPIFAVQVLFHSFFVTNETPGLGFIETLISGIVNVVFDAILICGCKLEVEGAAIGTLLGYLSGAVFSLLVFVFRKNNYISIKICLPDFKAIFKTMGNGASDFIFNISSSIIGLIFNAQLLRYIGQDGINAYGILMYNGFVFSAIFIGFSVGTAPIIGYNLGSGNKEELHSLVNKMMNIILITSIVMVGLSEALAYPLACIFSKSQSLIDLSCKAMRITAICYIFCGFSIFITAMFTGLNNGLISGLLSFFRSLVFLIVLVEVLPLGMGSDGIWWSIVISEALSLILAGYFFFSQKKKYGY